MARLRPPRHDTAPAATAHAEPSATGPGDLTAGEPQPAGERATRRAGRVIGRVAVLGICATIAAAAVIELRHTSTAAADPSARDWYRLRVCESSNNYRIDTGNDHYGAYQFDLATWRSVGGTGYPNQASPAEQDARALRLYRMRGWQPWQCASIVGLREDSDARSGRISDITVPRSGPRRGSHAWPGVYYSIGDHSSGIRQWQLRMKARGAPLTGTGQFGPHTLAVVKAVQRQNGLKVTGLLGPNTWKLAWSGKYSAHPRPVKKAQHTKSQHTKSAPRWPGPQYFSVGDHSTTIRTWQLRMKARGAHLTGTGRFGPHTLAVVNRIQRLNHLLVTGILGPNTWKLAWTGTYSNAKAVPRWPGPQYFSIGDHSRTVRTWQLRMKARGAHLTGTGRFGPNTLAVVNRIQRLNHLPVTGILGPVTWQLAWTGRY